MFPKMFPKARSIRSHLAAGMPNLNLKSAFAFSQESDQMLFLRIKNSVADSEITYFPGVTLSQEGCLRNSEKFGRRRFAQ